MSKLKILILLFLYIISIQIEAVTPRKEFILSGPGWHAWIDSIATWKNDKLYLPDEVNIQTLPINQPTIGWKALYASQAKHCSIPASVEELFGKNNEWSYHGVSWFYRTFNLPLDWDGMHVYLTISQYRQRVEVYINEHLAGYDVIGMVPYRCDISAFLKPGASNRIALRVTNPGGNRGWEDFQNLEWGTYPLISDKDYSGIGGSVILQGCQPVFVEDIFVKNLPKAKENKIEVQVLAFNHLTKPVQGSLLVEIIEKAGGKTLCSSQMPAYFYQGESKFKIRLSVPEAKLWSEDNPQMYTCKVTLRNGQQISDIQNQFFGFRVFEVKEVNGQQNYYLNDKRIRLRSAIDWGIYAFTGLYPTSDAAYRSISAVKDIGHNCLSFHRRMGDAPLLVNADTLGVYLYEEPGGFHSGGQNRNIDKSQFLCKQMYERIRRMVMRDRNHPSLLIYTLCNEDNEWTNKREYAMRLIHELDDSRAIVNSSGGSWGGYMKGTHHIRPYESEIRTDYNDHHTVDAGIYFEERDLNPKYDPKGDNGKGAIDHITAIDSTIVYWGEVRCFPGVFNSYLIHQQNHGRGGYDMNLYESQSKKIADLYERCRMQGMANGAIQTPADLTKQAARGLMYTDGRLGQRIMASNAEDGYAINGWSPGPDMPDEWSSAIVDLNRNINGPIEDIRYWNRPLQIAIFRTGGKYFTVGQKARFDLYLINEGKLSAGEYQLKLRVKDGRGKYTQYKRTILYRVIGGDCFAQLIEKDLLIKLEKDWNPGYITLEASLTLNNKEVANGIEQVLYKNRSLAGIILQKRNISVLGWNGAVQALSESGVKLEKRLSKRSLILLGTAATERELDEALAAAKDGARIVMQFDSIVAEKLYKRRLLISPVKFWGGCQSGYWRGNGAAYIDRFVGDQPIPSGGVISTRSWEVTGEPKGFWPFISNYPQRVYGAYFAHHQKSDRRFSEDNNTLIVIGELDYGKGKILLNSSYLVDENTVFSDLLFFKMLEGYIK